MYAYDISMPAAVGVTVLTISAETLPQSCCMPLPMLRTFDMRSEDEIK